MKLVLGLSHGRPARLSLVDRFTASGFDVGSQVDHTGYERISIAPSLTWRPDNDTTLTVLGTYQRDPKAGFYKQLPHVPWRRA